MLLFDFIMNFPRVGVGVIVKKEGKVLAICRKGAHGAGTWSIPGGHLEFNESFEECAKREVFEETGVKIKNVKFAGVTNDIFEKEDKHDITIFMIADWHFGREEIKELEKCSEIKWDEWRNFPRPLFIPLKNFIYSGFNPE